MADTSMTQQQNASKKGALHLNEATFEETIKTAGTPVFVDFFAEWCGPCKLAAPVVDKLAGEYDGKVVIAKLDTDENNALAKQYGVMSIPTVIIFKHDGEKVVEVERKIGFPGEAGYRQMLERVAPKADQAKAA